MKELHTSKPLVLGLIGLPGAGKTRFATEFSTMFGAPLLESDMLRRQIFGDHTPGKAHEEGLKRAYRSLSEELFKSKRTFVMDGYLNDYAARSEVRVIAKKAGYDVLLLWVQTSETVARDRSTRQLPGATNYVISGQAFTRAQAALEAPRSGETHVVMSGQRTFASQIRPLLMKIAEGHTSELKPPKPEDRPPRRSIFIR